MLEAPEKRGLVRHVRHHVHPLYRRRQKAYHQSLTGSEIVQPIEIAEPGVVGGIYNSCCCRWREESPRRSRVEELGCTHTATDHTTDVT